MSLHVAKSAGSPESSIHMLHDLQASLSEFVRPRDLGVEQRLVAAPADEGASDVLAQLETLNSLVETSQTAIQTLFSTIKQHEVTVSGLKSRLSEEASQKDVASKQSARFESAIKVEAERAAAADARVKSAEEKLKSLRDREAAVRERIDRLTANVASLATTGQPRPSAAAAVPVDPNGAVNRAS